MRIAGLVTMAAMLASPAVAADYLTDVTSQVYQTPGDHVELTKRAAVCINQNLTAGLITAPTVLSSDPDTGVVVANNAFQYNEHMVGWLVRTTFTFEAKDGRFRIKQTNLQRMAAQRTPYTTAGDQWAPIGKWPFSGWEKASAAISGASDKVAACVIGGAKSDAW